MGSEARDVHIYFLPFLSQGHLLPSIDMAKMFAARGVKSTIITTPLNEPLISRTLHTNPNNIRIETIEFRGEEFGIPKGMERMDTSLSPTSIIAFLKATMKMKEPLELLLQRDKPHCLVASSLFPWATDSASKFCIPRIVLHGSSLFYLCASLCMRLYQPYKDVSSDSEPFTIPSLPGDVKITRDQVAEISYKDDEEGTFTRIMKESRESEVKSLGMVTNTFLELEGAYVDHYRNVFGRRIWSVGPVSLCNGNNQEKAKRGSQSSAYANDEHYNRCLEWLASKKPESVVYVCFGSLCKFPESQVVEIAAGLEASGTDFVWVVKEESLPGGFEERNRGKGLVVRGWAPQLLIMEHVAVGGFVTHCGWNSVLEAVSGGLPMVTWPVFGDQFYNEKLICDVLKIGVPVGSRVQGGVVEKGAIEGAVKRVMVGEEAGLIRERAKLLALQAKRAVQVGGSSYNDLDSLINQIRMTAS